MNECWYSFDPEEGFETHDTAEEAKRAAEEILDYYRDQAGDGWHENTHEISWGRLIPHESAAQTNVEPSESGEFDYTCDYELVDVRVPDGEGGSER